jgi:DNA-binding response OmpR family regulator
VVLSLSKKIFLLEDDLQLHSTVKQFLEHLGYAVLSAHDAHEARDVLYENRVDLMLLDVKVPYQNGFDLLLDLREEGNQSPAIFITSLHTVEDLTRGFDAGCDDYIRKPFALKELQLRIEANLKKSFLTHDNMVHIDKDRIFDIKEYKLTVLGMVVPLKRKEVKLLAHFLTHPNEVLSYENIYRVLWDYEEEPNPASLRTYIHTLRQHLGKARIETIKGIGYRYAA